MDNLHKNKVAVISGGLGDIGKATALAFARQGADVAICDIHASEEARDLLQELEGFGVKASYDKVDVSNAAEVHTWLASVEKNLGLPTLIVANAATATIAGIQELSTDQWDRELQVNLNGAFYMTQYATQRLVQNQKPGRVVFVGSWAGHAAHAHLLAYSVSKAAVRMLCQCMALELASHNILVNEIAPGYVDAGLSGKIWAENPGLKTESASKVPIKRLMSADDVGRQIVQLCHPENNHMTGSTLLIDGGLSLIRP